MERVNDIRVKFCGLTRLEDAIEAVRAGADMLGFNFYDRSPRYIAPQDCARLVSALRMEIGERLERIYLVGVFVNASVQEIRIILDRCMLDLAQLSGNEGPDVLASLGERAFKVIRGDGREMLERIVMAYPRREEPPALLVDASSPGLYGGSGQMADWDQARRLARRLPILLAGGLKPANVAEAIQMVNPWGVDVASGVESMPGRKDQAKMIDFVMAVRGKRSQLQ